MWADEVNRVVAEFLRRPGDVEDAVEWLERELDYLLGLKLREPRPCPACAEPLIGGEAIYCFGCPECARRQEENK